MYLTLERKNKTTFSPLSESANAIQNDGTISRGNFHTVKNKITTDIVRKDVNRSGNNYVTGRKPPPTNNNETHLPQVTRVTLSHLCSGQCARLCDFQFKIGNPRTISGNSAHLTQTVQHRFDCPARPTMLTPLDLCNNPWEVADFLRLLPDLPPFLKIANLH